MSLIALTLNKYYNFPGGQLWLCLTVGLFLLQTQGAKQHIILKGNKIGCCLMQHTKSKIIRQFLFVNYCVFSMPTERYFSLIHSSASFCVIMELVWEAIPGPGNHDLNYTVIQRKKTTLLHNSAHFPLVCMAFVYEGSPTASLSFWVSWENDKVREHFDSPGTLIGIISQCVLLHRQMKKRS